MIRNHAGMSSPAGATGTTPRSGRSASSPARSATQPPSELPATTTGSPPASRGVPDRGGRERVELRQHRPRAQRGRRSRSPAGRGERAAPGAGEPVEHAAARCRPCRRSRAAAPAAAPSPSSSSAARLERRRARGGARRAARLIRAAAAAGSGAPWATKSSRRISDAATARAPTSATIAATTRISLSASAVGRQVARAAGGARARPGPAYLPGRGAGPRPSAARVVILLVSSAWKIAPSAAMPVAMPTWRKVLLMPRAMPLRCGGDDADGGRARAPG